MVYFLGIKANKNARMKEIAPVIVNLLIHPVGFFSMNIKPISVRITDNNLAILYSFIFTSSLLIFLL